MRQFSRRGERVTDFERALIAEALADAHELQSVFLDLARRVGIDALVVFFDELGSEKVHVPTREYFFGVLFRKQRDADVVRRLANGEEATEIAKRYGIHPNTVWHIGRHSKPDDVVQAGMVDGAA